MDFVSCAKNKRIDIFFLFESQFSILFKGSPLNITIPQVSNCTTPGYVSYNIGDGTCYKYFSEVVKQYEAEIRCLQDNARLFSLNNSNSLTIVKALTRYGICHIFASCHKIFLIYSTYVLALSFLLLM